MSQLDLLKLLQTYGEETELADFTPEELAELLEQMQQEGGPRPMTMEEFISIPDAAEASRA